MDAIRSCLSYRKMGQSERAALQVKRLNSIVRHAKQYSPYFANKYREIGADFQLLDLPAISKEELMIHWNDWVTDRNVALDDVLHFMENLDNIGRKWQGKYLVFTTSGSTGNPLVSLSDSTSNNVTGAISLLRAYARKQDMKSFIIGGGKSVGIYADNGFYLGNSSIRTRILKMPWKKRQIGIVSALAPLERIVDELNVFQPAMLGGYPSNLEMLIEEKIGGRLHISPVIIMTGGEYLSPQLRDDLSAAFGCYVQTSYACTEGGTIACECEHRHLHINDDWVIVEPVDQNNRPVPDGVQSDKILLTNLYNYTQPFIRYEVTDRVVMHREGCPCSNPSPWLELEGRNDDVVSFAGKAGTVKIPPLAIYAALKEVHILKRFQLLAYPGNAVALRLVPCEGADADTAFTAARAALEELFVHHGVIGAKIEYDAALPSRQPNSGKFKHILHMLTA